MAKSNIERMLDLVEEAFDTRNDPEQLDVNEQVLEKLHQIHPSTLSEFDDGKGPVVWVLLIPTTQVLMHQFLNGELTEQELFANTNIDTIYDSIYLCSALVLPEYRGKGIANKLAIEAIESIKKQYSIKSLFVWPFSKEGNGLARKIAQTVGLELFEKK